ncbi:MAG: 3-methylornithine--L-lysine ligase PylC, partial [Thermoleophilia bacterium]
MRLAIVGGKLQGTEAAYLAGEAGYEVVLIDRRPERPAAGLAAEVHVFDITADPARAREVLLSCDAVLPACEDDRALEFLTSFVPMMGLPLLFDLEAYAVSQSKLRSNALFERLDLPRPLPWPGCGFPAVVKPSVGSGSKGVRLVTSEPGLVLARAALAADGAQAVVEEYVAGPSLSIEAVALGGEVVTLLPTWLEFDAAYDCKRVVAPVGGPSGAVVDAAGAPPAWVSDATLAALDAAARRLAEGVALGGVMDVEVMVSADGTPKVIEIDARLPSQTPAAVFHASDVNIVALLAETFAAERPPAVATAVRRGAVYEHVLVEGGRVEVLGEHIVGAAGPLRRCDGLYGAD